MAKSIVLPALGRHFELGMFYDCRSDTLIPDITLWDPDVLKNNKIVRVEQTAHHQVIMKDSLETKSNALAIDDSLKLSFLGDLIKVSGSACYLDDRKSSNHQERVTLKYKSPTRSEKLTMKQIEKSNMTNKDVIKHRTATHVVTGITYGAQAFFVFDHHVSSDENQREIAGNLHALVAALPGIFEKKGDAAIKLTEDKQNYANKFQCHFYGDFRPMKNPTTYKDAALLYRDLPKLLGKKGKNAVPLEVRLFPLQELDSKAAKLVRQISKDIVQKVEVNLEQLFEVDVRCSDLLSASACQKFQGIKEEIFHFKERTKQFSLIFKEQLMHILPRIRGGNAEESELIRILENREASPFSHLRLITWIEKQEFEVNVLPNYITNMPNIDFSSEINLLVESIEPDIHVVVCFMINLARNDSQAIDMKKYIKDRSLPSVDDTQSVSILDEATDIMVQNAQRFNDFNAANIDTSGMVFRVVKDPVPSGDWGGFIHLYKDGELIDTNYAPTSQPGPPRLDKHHHDELFIQWEQPDVNQSEVKEYEVSYQVVGSSEGWTITCTTSPCNTFIVNKLTPATPYHLKVRALCEFGYSEYSHMSDIISTRPTSPPGKPEVIKISPVTAEVTWSPPDVIANGVTIDYYTVRVKNMRTNSWKDPIKTQAREEDQEPLIIELEALEQYYATVEANCEHANSLASDESSPIFMGSELELMKYEILCKSKKVGGPEEMPILQIPLTVISESSEGDDMICKYSFGSERSGSTKKKKVPTATLR